MFFQLIQDTRKRYPFELHAYCCMRNHYHMLLETQEKEIWMIMRRINHLYASFYNYKYGFTGHLFQGRYKSCLVKSDAYFLQTSRYIHLNPVKAKIVNYPENYHWSSYRMMVGIEKVSLINVNTEKTLSYFEEPRRQQYKQFVETKSLETIEKEMEIQNDLGE